MNEKLEHSIDIFQRNLLKKNIEIHYPHKIANENLYNKTGIEPWIQDTQSRRLRWTGHMMRLDKTAPVRKSN